MAPFDPAKNIRFVQEVEKYPCLYNYNHAEYNNKEATDSAWQKVAEEMADTVNSCKERWRNIRTVFVRKQRIGGPSLQKPKPYYLTDVMQFIMPYIKVRPPADAHGYHPFPHQSIDEAKEQRIPKEDTTAEEALVNGECITKEEVIVKEECFAKEGILEEASVQEYEDHWEDRVAPDSEVLPSTSTAIAKPYSHTEKRSNAGIVDQTLVDFAEVKKPRLNTDDNDPRKQFLLSLLPDVHAMTNVQMRKFRRLVLDAVDAVLDDP